VPRSQPIFWRLDSKTNIASRYLFVSMARVHFGVRLDSGAGGDLLVDSALAKAAGLHPTGWGRSFGEGPVSIVVRIAYIQRCK
jgi:hypothetical protein